MRLSFSLPMLLALSLGLAACTTSSTQDQGLASLGEGAPTNEQADQTASANPGAGNGLPSLLGESMPGEEAQTQQTTPAQDPVTLESGLTYQVITEGTGQAAKVGDTVAVHYNGMLTDGSSFDSSVGGDPFVLTLGQNRVIQGWEQGLPGMKVGEVRRLTIPPALGYGAQGAPPKIPGNATLVFDVQLMAIQQ